VASAGSEGRVEGARGGAGDAGASEVGCGGGKCHHGQVWTWEDEERGGDVA
jgi:hypothetical protein